MKRAAGFTLIEIMIAVAIIAILSAIAIPAYTDYVTRGRLAEAKSNLADMSTKLEQFLQDNRTFVGACAAGTVAPLPAASNAQYFTITCPTLTATAYTVQADGKAGTSVAGFQFTIDQTGAKATTAAPAGWTANAACWISRKGGLC